MSLTINMNLYTKRERQALLNASGGFLENLHIDPMKAQVAVMFPEGDWDMWYFRCRSVANALTQLSLYHPTARTSDWVWRVPRTPSVIRYTGTEKDYIVRPVANPVRLHEYLEVIWNRPREELCSIINVLQKLTLPSVKNLNIASRDSKNTYWCLTWTETKFGNNNVIFLHRG